MTVSCERTIEQSLREAAPQAAHARPEQSCTLLELPTDRATADRAPPTAPRRAGEILSCLGRAHLQSLGSRARLRDSPRAPDSVCGCGLLALNQRRL
jgi:hypothetical protein